MRPFPHRENHGAGRNRAFQVLPHDEASQKPRADLSSHAKADRYRPTWPAPHPEPVAHPDAGGAAATPTLPGVARA